MYSRLLLFHDGSMHQDRTEAHGPHTNEAESDGGVIVDSGCLTDLVVETLIARGASANDAKAQAFLLVEADLRNQHSHGVQRLPILVDRLCNDLIRSPSASKSVWVTDSVLQVDGARGFGPAVAFEAVDDIVERATTQGIAIATVTNSNHIGMLAPYVERVVAAGQIGIALTTSEALVHAWGGTRAVIGTNPIGIGIPTATEPLILDMATSAVSMGKILEHVSQSTSIPLGWAVDEAGMPTTDAFAAAKGAISPFGGAKGYALGIALEVLVATLAQSSLGDQVVGTLDADKACTKGDVFVAISIERLGLTGALPAISAYLQNVRSGAKTGALIDIPGDRARRQRAQRLRDGIPLSHHSWARTLELLEETRSE